MATRAIHFAVATMLLLLATMFTCSLAHAQVSGGGDKPVNAQCGCPSGGGDSSKSTNGFGLAMPEIVDLAGDPTWKVRSSEQDGIRYLKSNNATNGLRVEAAQIGTMEWVIQAGTQLPVVGRTVYRDDKEEVVLYRQLNRNLWIVLPVESPH